MASKFSILVSNGYRAEWRDTIEAKSVAEARKLWLAKCAPSQTDFVARKIKDAE